MSLHIHPDPVPLRVDEAGAVRVGKTRVLLDLVVLAYEQGSTPEAIVEELYPSLDLADVYAAIAYYLRHTDEVRAFLTQREQEADRLRRETEGGPGYQALRQGLVKFKADREQRGAAARE